MLSLTKEEIQAIIFIVIVSLVGLGMNILLKNISPSARFISMKENLTKLDLNKADLGQLDLLKGFGTKISQRIIEYRKEHGNFTSFDELTKIKGITKKRLIELQENYFIP